MSKVVATKVVGEFTVKLCVTSNDSYCVEFEDSDGNADWTYYAFLHSALTAFDEFNIKDRV